MPRGVETRRTRREKETRILGEPRSRVKPPPSEVHSVRTPRVRAAEQSIENAGRALGNKRSRPCRPVHSGDNVSRTESLGGRTESPLLAPSFASREGGLECPSVSSAYS